MSDRPTQRPNRGPAPLPGQKPKSQRSWRFYVGIAAAVIALILILQNSQEVEINYIFATTTAPLIFILVIVFALGALTGWLLPQVRRGRKRDKEAKD
jgi:uncharacterized integral membrane protein